MNKFKDQKITAKGETRAWVSLTELKTLWFNTGTRCNLTCKNCYIESSPKNDRLSYLSVEDIAFYLNEIKEDKHPVELIGLTGGEPFLNPEIITILDRILNDGHEVLVLTNAYRVLDRHIEKLLSLKENYGDKLHLRVSLDHYTKEVHEAERGEKTFDRTISQVRALVDQGFNVSLAGRSLIGEDDEQAINGYQVLMEKFEINLKLSLGDNIVIFPEMMIDENVPEITTSCWDILSVSPDSQMCATERMIVKRKEQEKAVVLPCTLLAYDEQFELGNSLKESETDVYLNHVYCSKFCALLQFRCQLLAIPYCHGKGCRGSC